MVTTPSVGSAATFGGAVLVPGTHVRGPGPLTGRELRLTESTTDEAEAKRILNRFRAQVDAQQNARTKATLGAAIDAWLRVHEVEQNTRLEQAGRIAAAAWEQDESWGTLVWLVMVTAMRRAELLALRWSDVDLAGGKRNVRRNYVRVNGRAIEKNTKTHQMRRISLDPATVEVLAEHR